MGPSVKRRNRCTCWRTIYINSYTDGACTNITNPLPTRRSSLTCQGESRGDRSPQEEAARRQHDHILLRLQPERKEAKRDLYRLMPFCGDVEVTSKTLRSFVENKQSLMRKTSERIRLCEAPWCLLISLVCCRSEIAGGIHVGIETLLLRDSHPHLLPLSSPSLHTALTRSIRYIFPFCNTFTKYNEYYNTRYLGYMKCSRQYLQNVT